MRNVAQACLDFREFQRNSRRELSRRASSPAPLTLLVASGKTQARQDGPDVICRSKVP